MLNEEVHSAFHQHWADRMTIEWTYPLKTIIQMIFILIVAFQVDSMAGMTSQPSMGAMVACAKGTKLDTGESQASKVNPASDVLQEL